MGELSVTRDPAVVLASYGLGSCIGVSVYDPVAKVGGLAHVMLPSSKEVACQGLGNRFADVAVPALVEKALQMGAVKKRLVCRLAGGARMLLGANASDGFKIGERNIEAVGEALKRCGITPAAEDTGGLKGRTLRLYVDTGRVIVKVIGQVDREL